MKYLYLSTSTSISLSLFLAEAATLLGAPPCPDPYGIHAYAHPEDCGAYFLCTNGTLTFEYCENGLLFDGHGSVYNHCNYNWAVQCGNRKVDCKYHKYCKSIRFFLRMESRCLMYRGYKNAVYMGSLSLLVLAAEPWFRSGINIILDIPPRIAANPTVWSKEHPLPHTWMFAGSLLYGSFSHSEITLCRVLGK